MNHGAGRTPHNVDVFVVARWGCAGSVLSVVSAVTMIWLFCKHKRLMNTLWNRVIVQLGVMYIIGGVVAMVTEVPLLFGSTGTLLDNRICLAQAFMVQWLAPLDLLFNLFLITALYLTVVRGINVARAEPWIVFLIWVLPAIASAILLSIGGIFGPAGAWCWVTLEHFNLRISVLYAWVWTGFVLMLTMEALVIRRLRVLAQVAARVPGTPVQARLQQHRFTSDPLIYIVTWTPSTVNRILERFNMALVDNSTAFAAQLFSIQTGGFLFFMLFLRNNWGTLRRVPAPPTPTVTTALLSSQCDAHSAGDPRPALPLHHSGGHSQMTDP